MKKKKSYKFEADTLRVHCLPECYRKPKYELKRIRHAVNAKS